MGTAIRVGDLRMTRFEMVSRCLADGTLRGLWNPQHPNKQKQTLFLGHASDPGKNSMCPPIPAEHPTRPSWPQFGRLFGWTANATISHSTLPSQTMCSRDVAFQYCR